MIRLGLVLLLLASSLFPLACAASRASRRPPPPQQSAEPTQPPEDPVDACIVLTRYPFGTRKAVVKAGRARIRGLFGEQDIARLEENGTLSSMGSPFGVTRAQLEEGRLVVPGLFGTLRSEPIEGGVVRVSMPLGTKKLTYSNACSTEQAALGAFAILLVEAAEAQ